MTHVRDRKPLVNGLRAVKYETSVTEDSTLFPPCVHLSSRPAERLWPARPRDCRSVRRSRRWKADALPRKGSRTGRRSPERSTQGVPAVYAQQVTRFEGFPKGGLRRLE